MHQAGVLRVLKVVLCLSTGLDYVYSWYPDTVSIDSEALGLRLEHFLRQKV